MGVKLPVEWRRERERDNHTSDEKRQKCREKHRQKQNSTIKEKKTFFFCFVGLKRSPEREKLQKKTKIRSRPQTSQENREWAAAAAVWLRELAQGPRTQKH